MPAPRNILGVSAYYHDAAAALVGDGKIISAAQEERFTRKKNDSDFPRHAVQFCLRHANLRLAHIPHRAVQLARRKTGFAQSNPCGVAGTATGLSDSFHRASSISRSQRVLSVAL